MPLGRFIQFNVRQDNHKQHHLLFVYLELVEGLIQSLYFKKKGAKVTLNPPLI